MSSVTERNKYTADFLVRFAFNRAESPFAALPEAWLAFPLISLKDGHGPFSSMLKLNEV